MTAVPQRFVVLDSLRGLCALSVVAFHLHVVNGLTELEFFRSAGLFVEFFFTLSGFVLCHGYAQKPFGLNRARSYLISRAFRIFPLHVVLLLAFSVLMLIGGDNTLTDWVPNLLLLQAWLPWTNAFSFNGPAWSISVEFYLYLLFGLVLFFSQRRLLVFALIFAGCAACVLFEMKWIGAGGFRGMTCFFLGALAYRLHGYWRALTVPRGVADALEIGMLAALYFCLTQQYAHKSFWASCFFAVFILLFAREGGGVSRLLQQPAFVQLGHWSFSIYLTHFLLIHLLVQGVQSLSPDGEFGVMASLFRQQWYLDTGNIVGNQILIVAVLALVLRISSWTYRHIEQRGIALGKRLAARWQPVGGIAGVFAAEKA